MTLHVDGQGDGLRYSSRDQSPWSEPHLTFTLDASGNGPVSRPVDDHHAVRSHCTAEMISVKHGWFRRGLDAFRSVNSADLHRERGLVSVAAAPAPLFA